MSRRRLSTSARVQLLLDHDSECHLCAQKIDGVRETWEVEHIIPLALGGLDEIDNMAPAHVACHRAKTKGDARQIAKAKRVKAKHEGAFRPRSTLPGGKGSAYKRKVGGKIERRET